MIKKSSHVHSFFSLTMYYSFGRTVECYFMVVQSLCSYKYHNNDIYHANLLNTFISGLKDPSLKVSDIHCTSCYKLKEPRISPFTYTFLIYREQTSLSPEQQQMSCEILPSFLLADISIVLQCTIIIPMQ